MRFSVRTNFQRFGSLVVLLGLVVPGAARVTLQVSGEALWEGRYVRVKDGTEVSGSEQSWVLRREAGGGYSLESRFSIVNQAAALVVQLGAAGAQIDSKLRRDAEKELAQKELVIHLDKQLVVQTVEVKGEKLTNKKPVVVAACKRTLSEFECQGANGNSKLKVDSETLLLFSFPFPMLLAPHIVHAEKSAERKTVFKVGFLEIVDSVATLREAEAQLAFERDEPATIGDRRFKAGRYRFTVTDKGGRLLDTVVWASRNGLVLLMENQQLPGEQIALVEYKPHAPFP